MGQGQSASAGEPPVMKTSYYTLLDITREATDDEIKKAYRKKALELHPDRNYGREEEATKLFADIQLAYEVLSDPQERAWYDSHEGAILRGFEDGDGRANGQEFEYGIKITTSEDVNKVMASVAGRRVDFANVPNSFFQDLKSFFEKVGEEEARASKMEGSEELEYPTFGDKDDDYDDVVKHFYNAWSSFATAKSYFWVDKWNLTEAPDRRVRRAMEKENKKARDDAIREFNESIRMLVAFIRKRDPRYRPNFQTEADRQKMMRESAKAQAAKSRAANAKKVEVEDAIPEWAKTKDPGEEEESEDEEIEETHFECIACSKLFKSEKQYEAHERSKKHQKTLHSLQRRMRKENDLLHLDDDLDSCATTPMVEENPAEEDAEPTNGDSSVDEEDDIQSATEEVDNLSISSSTPPSPFQHPSRAQNSIPTDVNSDSDTTDPDYAPRPETHPSTAKPTTTPNDQPSPSLNSPTNPSVHDPNPEPKLGKAAQKRAKKAAKAAIEESSDAKHSCAVCNAAFPSRSRLFQHIADHGHAAPVAAVKGSGRKNKKR